LGVYGGDQGAERQSRKTQLQKSPRLAIENAENVNAWFISPVPFEPNLQIYRSHE
jgi:hypothetical protein